MTKHKTQVESSILDRPISRKTLMHLGDISNYNIHLPRFTADYHNISGEGEYCYKIAGVNKKRHRADIGCYAYNPCIDSFYGIDKECHSFENMRTPYDDDWDDYLD